MKTSKLFPLVLCALFAALTAVCSQIGFTVGPIPFNLATFSVLLAGGLLGYKYAPLSMAVYLLLGVCGVPVFSNMRSGPATLFGATGGFLFGYVLAAFAVGFVLSRIGEYKYPKVLLVMLVGPVCYFVPGLVYYMFLTGTDIVPALGATVLPFLPGDAAKVLLAALLTCRLRPFLARYGLQNTAKQSEAKDPA